MAKQEVNIVCDTHSALRSRAQLAIVAGGARPAWLAMPGPKRVAEYAGLIPLAEELGLLCHVFKGLDRLGLRGERLYSGYLFYNPKTAAPADIDRLKKDGWGCRSSSDAIGRVLGYDHPGYTGPHAQLEFNLVLVRPVSHGKEVFPLTPLFWYNVPRLTAKSVTRAAQLAVEMQFAIAADKELGYGCSKKPGQNWRPQILISYNPGASKLGPIGTPVGTRVDHSFETADGHLNQTPPDLSASTCEITTMGQEHKQEEEHMGMDWALRTAAEGSHPGRVFEDYDTALGNYDRALRTAADCGHLARVQLAKVEGQEQTREHVVHDNGGRNLNQAPPDVSASTCENTCENTTMGQEHKEEEEHKEEQTREYVVHDNGGRPFVVLKDGETVDIYLGEPSAHSPRTNFHTRIGHYTGVTQFFVGEDPEHGHTGNSILFRSDCEKGRNWYIFVGKEVYQFETAEEIRAYLSPMGNSDVPYPYATTDTRTYLMIEDVYIENSDLARRAPTSAEYTGEKEPYGQYYGHTLNNNDDKPPSHLFRKTVIHARRQW